jgi:hypothetical protein
MCATRSLIKLVIEILIFVATAKQRWKQLTEQGVTNESEGNGRGRTH